MSVVFASSNLGLSDEEILSISSKASNHDEDATIALLRQHKPNSNKIIRINTIFHYLKTTTDPTTYKELTAPHQNKLYVQQQIKLLTCTEKFKRILKVDSYVYSEMFEQNVEHGKKVLTDEG